MTESDNRDGPVDEAGPYSTTNPPIEGSQQSILISQNYGFGSVGASSDNLADPTGSYTQRWNGTLGIARPLSRVVASFIDEIYYADSEVWPNDKPLIDWDEAFNSFIDGTYPHGEQDDGQL